MGTSATTEPNGSRRLSAGDSGSRPGTVGRPRERRGKKGDSGYPALAGDNSAREKQDGKAEAWDEQLAYLPVLNCDGSGHADSVFMLA